MTDKKPAFKFQTNTPATVTLLFDEPKTGEGQYGPWFLYGAIINEAECNFFASPGLHRQIQEKGLKKNSSFVVTKKEDGTKTFFSIDPPSGVEQFANELEAVPAQQAISDKDHRITKIAIVKSYIEAGGKFTVEAKTEVTNWVNWIEGKAAPVVEEDPYADMGFDKL